MKYLEYEVKNTAINRANGDKTSLISGAVDYFGLHFTFDEEFGAIPGEKAVEFFKNRSRERVALVDGSCAIPNEFLEDNAQLEFRVIAGTTVATPWVNVAITVSGAILPESPSDPPAPGTAYVTTPSGDQTVAMIRYGESGLEYSLDGTEWLPAAGEVIKADNIVLLDSGESEISALTAKINELINILEKHGIVTVEVPEPEVIAPEILVIPDKATKFFGGEDGDKTVEDMIEDDVKVLADGSVVGTLKYVEGYKTYWPDNEAMQSGNFFPLTLGSNYSGGEKLEIVKNNGEPKVIEFNDKPFDPDIVLRVEQSDSFEIKVDDATVVTLTFTNATLQPQG